ncbi:GPI transamidase component PIG-T [Eufriesea mexicana]|uniref:GPI transamidase component PIG-T n=1 Tax=Eufriesea mexicana TaxID=516756 RepID=A0A310SRS7_9HYME|nr:PREDICTED: GPI transamidase component PIG-T [Eufriesea mexicana]OAD62487.1 GPI transamidase component PIG-T [Eufriesea mexicana]
MHSEISLLFSIFISFIKFASSQNDFFDEELMLKPLPSNHVYAYFQFTTVWETTKDINTFQHSHLFPRGLGEIISRHNVDELHLTLTRGLWNYQKWGYPYHDAGPGAEISTWFHKDVDNVDDEWKGLTNALAGLFCASLNFVNPANSMSPEFTFRPTGVIDHNVSSSHLRYSSLPREIVCTENLTPFKKLLPCNSKKGLSTLLNSAYIHNTNYHSIGIHFRVICSNTMCTKTSLELRQSVSLIYDTMTDVSQDWSIRKFFGLGIKEACPLATLSNVYIDISSNVTNQIYELVPSPTAKIVSLRGGQLNEIAVYDIRSHSITGIFNIGVVYNTKPTAGLNYPSVLYANRYVIGYGQERGSLVTKIYNNYWKTLDIVLLESIPWYLLVYLHSVTITCGSKNIIPLAQRYLPGKERKSPYYLELILRLPPHSVTKFSIEMDYSFLKWQEYPPDANHGFYMGPAIITALLPIARNYTALPLDGSTITSSFNASREGYIVQMRTESLLISLPTPDFSMPYNVICLACTAVALAFGPLHNITTKRLVLKRVEMDWKKEFLSSLFRKIMKPKKKPE